MFFWNCYTPEMKLVAGQQLRMNAPAAVLCLGQCEPSSCYWVMQLQVETRNHSSDC